MVFKQTYGTLPNGGRRNYYYNEISTCIAAGLLLAAIQVNKDTGNQDNQRDKFGNPCDAVIFRG